MAKIPTYTDDGGVPLSMPLSDGANYRQNMDYSPAFQGTRQNAQNWNALSNVFNAVAIRQQAMVNQIHVSNAQTAAVDAMNKAHTELMNVMGENVMAQEGQNGAPGRDDLYTRWQKSSTDIINQARSGLQNTIQREAFDRAMNGLMPDLNKQIGAHQMEQIEAAQEQARQANVSASLSLANSSVNMGDNTGAAAMIDGIIQSNNSMYAVKGMPKDAANIANQKMVFDWANSTIDQLSKEGHESMIPAFLDKIATAKYMSIDQIQTLQGKYQATQEAAEDKNIALSIVKSHTLANGEVDVAAAHGDVANVVGMLGKKYNAEHSFDSWYDAVAEQESGSGNGVNNYDAVNGRTGAYGKFQITAALWTDMKKQYGLPEDEQLTPENQEKYARLKLREYYEKYGPKGALVAWYAGEANAERYVNGEPDAIDENGNHYSWDAPQGDNGDEPSINEYVEQAMGRIAEANPSVEANYDPAREARINQQIDIIAADMAKARSLRNEQLLGVMRQWSLNNPNANMSDIISMARSLSDDPNEVQALINAGGGNIQAARSENRYQQSQQYNEASDYMLDHPDATDADLQMGFPLLTKTQRANLLAQQGKAESELEKWNTPDATAYLKGIIKENDLNQMDEADIRNAVTEDVKKYVKENGYAPSYDEIKGFIADNARKSKMNGGGSFFGLMDATSDYVTGSGLRNSKRLGPDMTIDENGNVLKWDPKTNQWMYNDQEYNVNQYDTVR